MDILPLWMDFILFIFLCAVQPSRYTLKIIWIEFVYQLLQMRIY